LAKYIKILVDDDFDTETHKILCENPNDNSITKNYCQIWEPIYENVLDKGFIGLVDFMGDDSSVVNAARVSYGKGTKRVSEDRHLIRYLMRHRHTTPFEMVEFKWHVKAPIFVFRQWHRHRTACLSGDTNIKFEMPYRVRKNKHGSKSLTLSELFRKWQPSTCKRLDKQGNQFFTRDRIKKMLLRVYDENSNQFVIGHINDIIYSGVKKVFKIILQDGKTLKCTKDHLMLTTIGWQRLETAIGLIISKNGIPAISKECFILTNGVPVYQSFEWMEQRRRKGYSVLEMATEAGCSYHTIRKWLKNHNLSFSRSEAAKSKPPWNKGVYGYKISLVVSEANKEKIRKARSGKNSNWWKGGITSDRAMIGRWTTSVAKKIHEQNNWKCTKCGDNKYLETHHIKQVAQYPELGYDINNLTTLCRKCHRQAHDKPSEYRKIKTTKLTALPSKIISIEYIGEENTYDISVDGEHHNFIANGMIVHNSINEASARFSIMCDDMYMPALEDLLPQSKNNRQGRGGSMSEHNAYACSLQLEQVYKESLQAYKYLLGQTQTPSSSLNERILYAKEFAIKHIKHLEKTHPDWAPELVTETMVENKIAEIVMAHGIALTDADFTEYEGLTRELARIGLPVATYSEMYWKANLHNTMHFLSLRCDEHAQKEIRVYADKMYEMMMPLASVCMEAFLDYQLKGSHLSSLELEVLKSIYIEHKQQTETSDTDFDEILTEKMKNIGMGKREITEFFDKFNN
jgi:thymidylate synthase (FAD)